MFESIFSGGNVAAVSFFIVLIAALACGVVYAFLSCRNSGSSTSFFVATALLPMTVAAVIALINGNLGVGVAIAGAFGLVRFRSAPGTAREIAAVFIAMAAGLAFGMGGMQDGNSEKGDHSTKGVKADNEVIISGGVITIKSYDDAIHANSDATLENGETATGNVTISGGTLTLYSKDDGIHADGTLTVSGGTIDVTDCYEGLEGTFVNVKGGDVSIVSSDDGINATTTSGTGITFEGGKVYIYAGGDGVDSNSRTSYQGIVFSGGDIVIVSASGGNSSIDTEQGYTYNGGNVLAICPANGMGNESMNCRNFSSVASKTTMNLTKGQTLTVGVNGEVASSVAMPCGLSALVIYLGSASASFSAA